MAGVSVTVGTVMEPAVTVSGAALPVALESAICTQVTPVPAGPAPPHAVADSTYPATVVPLAVGLHSTAAKAGGAAADAGTEKHATATALETGEGMLEKVAFPRRLRKVE